MQVRKPFDWLSVVHLGLDKGNYGLDTIMIDFIQDRQGSFTGQTVHPTRTRMKSIASESCSSFVGGIASWGGLILLNSATKRKWIKTAYDLRKINRRLFGSPKTHFYRFVLLSRCQRIFCTERRLQPLYICKSFCFFVNVSAVGCCE